MDYEILNIRRSGGIKFSVRYSQTGTEITERYRTNEHGRGLWVWNGQWAQPRWSFRFIQD